jgi:hypothetical protein
LLALVSFMSHSLVVNLRVSGTTNHAPQSVFYNDLSLMTSLFNFRQVCMTICTIDFWKGLQLSPFYKSKTWPYVLMIQAILDSKRIYNLNSCHIQVIMWWSLHLVSLYLFNLQFFYLLLIHVFGIVVKSRMTSYKCEFSMSKLDTNHHQASKNSSTIAHKYSRCNYGPLIQILGRSRIHLPPKKWSFYYSS